LVYKDAIESLLRELGVEEDDLMRKKLAQSRSRLRSQSKQRFNCHHTTGSRSRRSSVDDGDYYHCDEDDTGLSYDARNPLRHLPHHTPSDLLDEEGRLLIEGDEEREKNRIEGARKSLELNNSLTPGRDVYQDCHYRKGSSVYGYLINRRPDHPLAIPPPKCHRHSHHQAITTIADTADALRQINRLLAPGMILFAMLVLLFVSVAIVEAIDMVVKQLHAAAAAVDEEASMFTTISTRTSRIKRLFSLSVQGSGYVLVPQEDDEEKSIVDISSTSERGNKHRNPDNDDDDDIDGQIL
jgi:hypothetical protein